MTKPTLTEDDLDPIFFLAATDPDAMKAMNAELIDGFRATNGTLDGSFDGVPLLLLTTTGARSGIARTTPMNYTRTGPGYVVVASKSGAPRDPDWYHNLVAHPDVTIETPDDGEVSVHVVDLTGSERDAGWAQFTAMSAGFAGYEQKTSRVIPVLRLSPR
jgi:deazaflavin-dependent oxidoreductase (nitroreductase family)